MHGDRVLPAYWHLTWLTSRPSRGSATRRKSPPAGRAGGLGPGNVTFDHLHAPETFVLEP